MASAQIKQNRERDTLWADFKLFLLYFLMSHVVWLSQSIKIVLLSVLSPRNISCKCSPWTQADKKWRHLRSGPLGHGFVIWTTWIKGSSLLKGGKLFFFFLPLLAFCFVPSPSPLPPLLSGAALLPALLQLWGSSQCQVLVACFHVYKLGDKLLSREWFYSALDNTVSLTLSVTPCSVLHVR